MNLIFVRRLADKKYDAKYDSNIISPGTEYMRNFENTLTEFVSNKIKFDHIWQNCDILISGSSVSLFAILRLGEIALKKKFMFFSVCWRRFNQNYRLHSIIEMFRRVYTI